MNKKLGLLLVSVLTLTAFSFVACGDDDEARADDETPVATVTPEVSNPETGPSGIAPVDEAIEAMTGNDLQAVVDLIVLDPLACVTQVEGLGGPPECRADEAPGTNVDVVLFASCEGYYVRADQLEGTLARFVEGEVALHGVFGITGRSFADADYVAVFAAERDEGTLAEALYFTDEGIVGVDYGCGQQPEQYAQSGNFGDVIVAPE